MQKLWATGKPYTVHGPALSAGRTARNDKNDNKFAFTAPLCCNKFVLYLYTKMCIDPLCKPLGRNLWTKVTFSFSSLLFALSFNNLWKVSNRLEKCIENLIQTCQYNIGFSLNKNEASFPLSKVVSPKIILWFYDSETKFLSWLNSFCTE